VKPQFYEQRFFEKPAHASDHFFSGNSLKFRCIIEQMKTTIPENSYFVLSDADLLVLDPDKLHSTMLRYVSDYDIVGMVDNLKDTSVINIGLLLCKNTTAVVDFFTNLASQIETTGKQDQHLFNILIRTSGLKYTMFPLTHAIQSNMVQDGLYNPNVYVIQMLCSNKDYESNVFEKLMTACGFYDITPVLDCVPYVVKEALVLFCRDHLPSNPVSRVPIDFQN
jgi:hypothetical protein